MLGGTRNYHFCANPKLVNGEHGGGDALMAPAVYVTTGDQLPCRHRLPGPLYCGGGTGKHLDHVHTSRNPPVSHIYGVLWPEGA